MSASHALMGLARTGCSEPAGDLRLNIFCYQVSHEQQPRSLKQCVFVICTVLSEAVLSGCDCPVLMCEQSLALHG